MKRRVFLDGFDSHSLNSAIYWEEEISDILGCPIDYDDPQCINRIKDEASLYRSKSKTVTFALQYLSGPANIAKTLKASRNEGDRIFNAYHEKYRVSAKWVQDNTNFAKANGYIEGAFGLKLRTPKINSKDEGIAGGEMRQLNNMKSQSYGMLTNIAAIKMQDKIEEDNMQNDVIQFSTIHDAIYLLVRNNARTVKWVNDNLIKFMSEDFREGQVIHNSAELDCGLSWDKQYTLKNDASIEEVEAFLQEHNLRNP